MFIIWAAIGTAAIGLAELIYWIVRALH